MEKLLARLRQDYPALRFEEAEIASWSPRLKRVSYSLHEGEADQWSLLHELGHALANHQGYTTDINLVRKESEAWEKARELAKVYEVNIGDDHVQWCMDTYRDWLHKRSACPNCSSHGLQQNKALYCCPNCKTQWMVSSERFCRPYRLKMAQTA